MMGLGKLKWRAKFEVAGIIDYIMYLSRLYMAIMPTDASKFTSGAREFGDFQPHRQLSVCWL